MKITATEAFKIPGTDHVIEKGQEIEVMEAQELSLQLTRDPREITHEQLIEICNSGKVTQLTYRGDTKIGSDSYIFVNSLDKPTFEIKSRGLIEIRVGSVSYKIDKDGISSIYAKYDRGGRVRLELDSGDSIELYY